MKKGLLSKKAESVLITGIDGFTGMHLGGLLREKGLEVYGTSLTTEREGVFKADINDSKLLTSIVSKIEPTYVVHLAAISFVNGSNLGEFYKVNTIGTETLLESIANAGVNVKKVLVPSSATVYGNQNSSVLNEEMPLNPTNHYGCSKMAMELILRNFFDTIPIIITRPFNYTGVGQEDKFVIPKIVSHFKSRKEFINLGNIHTYREFNGVAFITEVYYRLLMSEYQSVFVNVCSGKTNSISEIISMLEEITHHKIAINIDPRFVRKNEIVSLCGSNERLKRVIDLPDSIDLKGLLRDMLDS